MNSAPATALPPHASARPSDEARKARFVLLALLAAVVCAYAGVVRCDFIDLDDRSHVIDNPLVAGGLTWAGIRDAFAAPHASLWIPLTWLSFMADASLFGLNPGAMHAVNLAWHAAATALLFLFLRRTTGRLWPCAMVAALFGLHPLNVESVAWVTERKNVLCATLWMLTLLAYARYAEKPAPARFLAVLVSFALALLAKPLAVTLPAALLLLDFWPLQRHRHTPWPRLVVEKLPLLVLALGAAAMQMHAVQLRGQSVQLEMLPLSIRVSNAIVSYARYLADLAWPAQLGVFHPHPLRIEWLALVIGAAVVLACSLAAWLQRVRRPWLLVGWCWFLGTLVPMIGLVQAGSQARADRFTYIAQIGVFLAFVWTVAEWSRRRVLVAAGSVALAMLGFGTARQVGLWQDSVTLFTHTLKVTGPNARVEALAGNAFAARGEYAKAIPHYQRALRILPDIAETWNELGAALTRLGYDREACAAFREALAREPELGTARYNLATALARLGDRAAAIGELQRLVAELPGFARAHFHLGRLLGETGAVDAAREHLTTAARLQPGDAEIRAALAQWR